MRAFFGQTGGNIQRRHFGGVPGGLGSAGVARTMIVACTERTREAIPLTPTEWLSPTVLPTQQHQRRKQLVPKGLAGSRPLGDHGRRFAPNRSRFAARALHTTASNRSATNRPDPFAFPRAGAILE